jgi:hypothetical protein
MVRLCWKEQQKKERKNNKKITLGAVLGDLDNRAFVYSEPLGMRACFRKGLYSYLLM